MLTSLAANGDVPEATILVAAFDLEPEDYQAIRAHAGALGDRVRFVDVTPPMLQELAEREWEAHYPLAVLGRLFLPTAIDAAGARLLTLDSDMIVNVSVRPLFEMDMRGDYLAAIHDTPRDDDADYFNSGMMVIDVDTYRHYDVTARSLRWLAERAERPRWPDQDALNTIVGHKWQRLDRRWNWAFCGSQWGDGPLKAEDYENAFIAHFTGQGKPWSMDSHAGRPLYLRYLEEYRDKVRRYHDAIEHVDANFVATAMEVLLGREPASTSELHSFQAPSARETIVRLARSNEFAANTLLSMKVGAPLPALLYEMPLTLRHKFWAAERLWLQDRTANAVRTSTSWNELLAAVVGDPNFRRSAQIAH
jgi:lipopolysaccharide biosynthesis glycosyltransferase